MRRFALPAVLVLSLVLLAGLAWMIRTSENPGAGAGAGANAGAGAGVARPAADDGPQTLAHVEGTVRDVATGAPVPGIDVIFAMDGAESTATSSATGRYAVDLPPGRHGVRAVGQDVYGLSAAPLTVGSGARVDSFDLRVARLARIDGRVVDSAGAPIAGATVTFATTLPGVRIDSTDLDPLGSAETGADGAFSVQVVPGAVTLTADRDGARGQASLPYVGPANVLTGVEIRIDRGAGVAGVVRDQGGAVVADATVSCVVDTDPPARRVARTGADGRFTLPHVPAGPAYCQAQAAAHGESARVQLEVRPGVSNEVELALREPAMLAGRVVSAASGAPIEGARVVAGAERSWLEPRSAITGADGAFRIAGVEGAHYFLVASAPGLATARARVVAPDGAIELRLAAPGVLAGVVSDDAGQPITNFAVRFDTWRQGRAFLSADGAYQIDEVEPGSYDIVISAPGYAPLTRRLTIPPGETVDGSARLVGGAVVAGVVRDDAGAPIAGALVSMLSGHEGEATRTDEAGRFELHDVAPGRRSLEVEHAAFVTRNEGGIVLAPGDLLTVDVTLTRHDGSGGGRAVEFAGIGASLYLDRERRVILGSLVAGAPAEVAGLLSGDEIVAIDGTPSAGRSLADIIEDIRGVVGTPVRLDIRRQGASPFTIDVVRGTVRFGG